MQNLPDWHELDERDRKTLTLLTSTFFPLPMPEKCTCGGEIFEEQSSLAAKMAVEIYTISKAIISRKIAPESANAQT